MPAQPQPVTQVQILPWLANPLTPLLWYALGATLLLTLLAVLRFRRSAEPCPISPRWLAVSAVVAVGFFASLSLGAQLANPITLYAAPVFMLVSTLLAWGAWHADGLPQREARVTCAALAAASTLATASLLACALLLRLATRDVRMDLDLGLGAGEAVSHLLPAVGAALLPLMLIPASHPRARPARQAVVVFTGFLLLLLLATSLAAAAAMTTPLPYESPLSDRYIYLNALVAVPPMLGALVAVGAGLATFASPSIARWAVLPVTAAAAFPLTWAVAGSTTLKTAFGFDWWRIAAAVAAGLLLGAALGPLNRLVFTLRVLLALAAIIACGVIGETLGAAPSHLLAPSTMLAATLGLYAACASAPRNKAAAGDPPPLADQLLAGCLLVAGVHAAALTLQSQLTYQARRFSAAFVYESNRQVDPEMRQLLQDGQHAVHIGGTRWAWVLPQATWWTRDGAWRDSLIIADHAQPKADDPVPAGHLYSAVITGPDRKRSDVSFTDAQYVALVQPVPIGQKSTILHTVTARFATPRQIQGWMRLSPANPRTWFAALAALPAAWWLTRRARSVTAAATFTCVITVALALVTGIAGVVVFAAGAGLLMFAAAARRDDEGLAAATLLTVYSVTLALLATVIPLAEVL